MGISSDMDWWNWNVVYSGCSGWEQSYGDERSPDGKNINRAGGRLPIWRFPDLMV